MSFQDLGIQRGLAGNLEEMGYRRPRPIQARAIPPLLEGRDVIGLAQTGTGKTAAFIAPIAHHLLADRPKRDQRSRRNQRERGPRRAPRERLRALVLCPTRELALQVATEAGRIVGGRGLNVACVYGKVGMAPQAEIIAKGVDILVGTPGRVRDLLRAGALTLASVRLVAIDEADRMLDLGFLPQVARLLEATSETRQTMLFTATMPDEIDALARRYLNDPVRVEVGRHTTTSEDLEQHLVEVHHRDKVPLLLHLLTAGERTGVLVFCRTRRRVGWVGAALARHGVPVGMVHGDRTQAQRLRALERFEQGDLAVLVATDVAARGLHLSRVRTVVNYDVPIAPEEYVHRVGRAGHGGGFAESFTLLSGSDASSWNKIVDTVGEVLAPETVKGFAGARAEAGHAGGADRRKPGARGAAKGAAKGRSRGGKSTQGSPSRGPKIRRAESASRFRGAAKRSRQSRPIKKGEQPGKGVVKRGGDGAG